MGEGRSGVTSGSVGVGSSVGTGVEVGSSVGSGVTVTSPVGLVATCVPGSSLLPPENNAIKTMIRITAANEQPVMINAFFLVSSDV